MDRGAWEAPVHGCHQELDMTTTKTSGLSYGTWDLGSSLWHTNSSLLSCEIQFPDQGLNQGSLYWDNGVLAPGPPGKSLIGFNFRCQFPISGLSSSLPIDSMVPLVVPLCFCTDGHSRYLLNISMEESRHYGKQAELINFWRVIKQTFFHLLQLPF